MIFNESTYYFLFLIPSVIAFHLASGRLAARGFILAAFGATFFAYYGYLHFGGWVGSAAIGLFIWELATSRLYRPGSRWCLLGVAQAIAILVAFKYIGFFSGAWRDITGGETVVHGVTAGLLPLGISFFTFEFIHYAFDVYRGRVLRSPLGTYAAFIFFFPTMVAGPIKRYSQFEAELDHARFDGELFSRGITRILAGVVKKQVLADTFTIWSDKLNTDALYSAPPWVVASWVLAYGMKIYFDFSGYSDIAIGSGYLFGIKIPENFDWPYLSKNIGEFWRRWHISLGRWLFDYLYVPLGGSERSRARVVLNLLVTFAVSGLWHGAAYNFLVWGLWHGAMMIVHRAWRSWASRPQGSLWNAVATAITFTGVHIGWMFFCMDIRRALFALGRIVGLA